LTTRKCLALYEKPWEKAITVWRSNKHWVYGGTSDNGGSEVTVVGNGFWTGGQKI